MPPGLLALHVHRKQDCPASLRASVGLDRRDGAAAGSLHCHSSSGLGQAVGTATWSQDSVSAVICLQGQEPCGFGAGGEPKEQDTQGPWIVVAKERPRRVACGPSLQ